MMKIESKILAKIAQPLESITITLSAREFEFITRAMGHSVPPNKESWGYDLYTELNQVCQDHRLNAYEAFGTLTVREK